MAHQLGNFECSYVQLSRVQWWWWLFTVAHTRKDTLSRSLARVYEIDITLSTSSTPYFFLSHEKFIEGFLQRVQYYFIPKKEKNKSIKEKLIKKNKLLFNCARIWWWWWIIVPIHYSSAISLCCCYIKVSLSLSLVFFIVRVWWIRRHAPLLQTFFFYCYKGNATLFNYTKERQTIE